MVPALFIISIRVPVLHLEYSIRHTNYYKIFSGEPWDVNTMLQLQIHNNSENINSGIQRWFNACLQSHRPSPSDPSALGPASFLVSPYRCPYRPCRPYSPYPFRPYASLAYHPYAYPCLRFHKIVLQALAACRQRGSTYPAKTAEHGGENTASTGPVMHEKDADGVAVSLGLAGH